jgi:GNAT superfamily N-acetyltransferase
MQIRTWDEVEPFEVHKLVMSSFGWSLSERRIRRQIRIDPRVKKPYAFYAVERGTPVAQVVPLRIPVRLTTGVETIGGLAAVCSHPTVWGRGYVRRLMAHVHDLFREEGIRIAALTTSRNIRGYLVYRKMGYTELSPFYRASRAVRRRPKNPRGLRLQKASKRDLPHIQSLFKSYTRRFLGWTERNPNFLGGEEIWDDEIWEKFRLVFRNDEMVGYLRVQTDEEDLVEEVIVPRARDFRATVQALEARLKGPFSSVTGLNSDFDRRRFRRLGYDPVGPFTWEAMALPLEEGISTRALLHMFGVSQGRFVLYPTDYF